MKHYLLTTLVFLSCSLWLFCQEETTFAYQSERLNDRRELQVHLPEGYKKDTLIRYPLTLVLDSKDVSDVYVSNATLLASADRAPKQIIVRLKPLQSRRNFMEKGELTEETKNYLYFIREEVLPHIQMLYRTSPFITIVGRRETANLMLSFLQYKDPVFNAYVCLHPIFDLDMNTQMQYYNINSLAKNDNTYYLYLSGNKYVERDTNFSRMIAYFNAVEAKNFHFQYDSLDSPNFVSAIGEAIPRAISKIFEIYAPISKQEFTSNIKKLSPLGAIAYLENKYIEMEYLFGTNVGIRESDVFAIESIIIDKENGDYLKVFGEMILNLYPFSHLGNYYIGRYYETGKQYAMALQQYKIGYGKMNPKDPNADRFYQNVERVMQK